MSVNDSFVDVNSLFFVSEDVFVIGNRKLAVSPLVEVNVRPLIVNKDITFSVNKRPNDGERFVCVGVDNLVNSGIGRRKYRFFEDVDLVVEGLENKTLKIKRFAFDPSFSFIRVILRNHLAYLIMVQMTSCAMSLTSCFYVCVNDEVLMSGNHFIKEPTGFC